MWISDIHPEHIVADATDELFLRRAQPQCVSYLDEDGVTRHVPVELVDFAKSIDVDENERVT